MSGSTATITFKLDGDVKTFQILAKDAESLKKVGTTATEALQRSGYVFSDAQEEVLNMALPCPIMRVAVLRRC